MENVDRKIQADIRLAQTSLLQGRSPAQIILSYDPNTRFNTTYNQAKGIVINKYNGTVLKKPAIGTMIWYKNVPNKWSNYIIAKIDGYIGNKMLRVEISGKQSTVHLNQISLIIHSQLIKRTSTNSVLIKFTYQLQEMKKQ